MADRCDETCQVAAELALGIADGEERARAHEHLASCPECRRAVEELSVVADDLLLLAPVKEPSAGFEARVLRRIGRRRLSWPAVLRLPAPARTGRARSAIAVAAVALTAAAAAVAGTLVATDDDRRLADQYRTALARANGEYFMSARLYAGPGMRAGQLFGYQGDPSWILVTVDPAHRRDVARAELILRDGTAVPLPGFRLDAGSWGGAIPGNLRNVAGIRLRDAAGTPTAAANLDG